MSGGCIIRGTEPVRAGRAPAPPPVPAGAAPTQLPQGPGPARGSADTPRWTSCQPAKQASPFLRGEKRPGTARCLYLSKGKSGFGRPPGQGSSHLASSGCLRPARLPQGLLRTSFPTSICSPTEPWPFTFAPTPAPLPSPGPSGPVSTMGVAAPEHRVPRGAPPQSQRRPLRVQPPGKNLQGCPAPIGTSPEGGPHPRPPWPHMVCMSNNCSRFPVPGLHAEARP